jgi:tyrosyl-DNA phosphodiesterase 2
MLKIAGWTPEREVEEHRQWDAQTGRLSNWVRVPASTVAERNKWFTSADHNPDGKCSKNRNTGGKCSAPMSAGGTAPKAGTAAGAPAGVPAAQGVARRGSRRRSRSRSARAAGRGVAPSLRVVSWNLDGMDERQVGARARGACREIQEGRPAVVFLQEVVAVSLVVVREELGATYTVVVAPDGGTRYFCVMLLRHEVLEVEEREWYAYPGSRMDRGLLQVRAAFVEARGVRVVLATSHLESLRDNGDEREAQLQNALGRVARSGLPALFGGDLNLRDAEAERCLTAVAGEGSGPQFTDAWVACGAVDRERFTWDSRSNRRDTATGRWSHALARFDRMYVMGGSVSDFKLGGRQVLPNGLLASDHYCVGCTWQGIAVPASGARGRGAGIPPGGERADPMFGMPVGITNVGSTCWLASSLQIIRAMPEVAALFDSFERKCCVEPGWRPPRQVAVACWTARVLRAATVDETTAPLRHLVDTMRREYGLGVRDGSLQEEDCGLGLLCLLDSFPDASVEAAALRVLVDGVHGAEWTCDRCRQPKKVDANDDRITWVETPHSDEWIEVHKFRAEVAEILDDRMATEEGRTLHCDKCDHGTMSRTWWGPAHGAVIGKGPTYMILGVKKKHAPDVKRTHVFPRELSVWAAQSACNETYEVHAAMVHVGRTPDWSVETGHYFAYVPLGCSTYARADDARVHAWKGTIAGQGNPYICVYRRAAEEPDPTLPDP